MNGKRSFTLLDATFVLGIISIIIFNRFVTKIGFGGVYFLEVVILIFFIKNIFFILESIRSFLWQYAFLLMGVSWLVSEWIDGQLSILNFRRFAIAFYIFVPIAIFYYRYQIVDFVKKYFYAILTLGSSGVFLSLPDLSPTLTAQVFGALLVAAVIDCLYVNKIWGLKGLLFSFACFAFVASGYASGQSMYRAPVAGVIIALFVVGAHQFYLTLKTGHTSFVFVVTVFFLILLFPSLLFFTEPGLKIVQQLLLGVGGLFGSDYLIELARSLAVYEVGGRGDAAGNAGVRSYFWSSIIENSFSGVFVAFFGEGHSFNFLTLLDLDVVFEDQELIEPHNSFVSIIFRYGYVGLTFFALSLLSLLRRNTKYLGWASLPFAFLAINFAMFEVALESPHGAVIFWFVFFLPYIFAKQINN